MHVESEISVTDIQVEMLNVKSGVTLEGDI